MLNVKIFEGHALLLQAIIRYTNNLVMTTRTGINVMVCNHLRSSDMTLLASDAASGRHKL